MPKRTVVGKIIVHRDGKRVEPKIGAAFDFTADELADIKRLQPGAVRIVVNEDADLEAQAKADAEAQAKADAEAQKKAEADAKAEAKARADAAAAKGNKPAAKGGDL